MGAAAKASLLDMSKPLDISLLDSTVSTFYGGSAEEVRCPCQACFDSLLCSSWQCKPGVHIVDHTSCP